MEPLPEGVELVAKPAPDVEVLVLGPGFDDVPALFKQLPRLKFVQSFSAGVDQLLPLIPQGVVLCGAVGVHDVAVSQWVLAVILTMERRIPEFIDLQRRGEWRRDIANQTDDLEGKTVLVVGYGSIGKAVALRLGGVGGGGGGGGGGG